MGAMASQISSLTIAYSSLYSRADQIKYQSSASQAFVQGIHRWPVSSPHKGQVTRKIFPFDDATMFKKINTPSIVTQWVLFAKEINWKGIYSRADSILRDMQSLV